MDDGYEVWNALDPNQATDANQDPDGDGLKNLDEYHIGSMAFINDSDGDGFWDNVEFTRDTDATDSTDFPIRSVGADVDANGTVNAVDVQLVVNGALGMTTSVPTNVDNTGGVNALDVQQVINAAVR